MFCLAYIGKHEIVTWLSAGAYLVVLIVFFLSVLIALSQRLGPWREAVLIGLINWAAVHLYELLIVAAPLYPLLTLLHARLSGRRVSWRSLAPTLVPLAVFLLHAALLYVSTPNGAPPLWERGVLPDRKLGTLLRALGHAFVISFKASLGSEHISLLAHGVKGYFRYVPLSWWTGLTLACALAGFLLIALREKEALPRKPPREVVYCVLAAGIYLTFFSPLVGFTTNRIFMPSRLLSLCGVGLSLLLGLAAAFTLHWRRTGVPVTAALLGLTLLQAFAMNSILYEHQTSWAYDSLIRAQLQATGIRPKPGDTIFISLPDHPLRAYWRTGFSQFEGGHARLLLALDYNLVVGAYPVPVEQRIIYRSEVRRRGEPVKIPADLPRNAFAFVVREEDYKLIPLDLGKPPPGKTGASVTRQRLFCAPVLPPEL